MSDCVQIGDATLYHGDCLEILPALSGIDAVLTDPPYSSGGMMRGDRMQDVHTKYVQTDSESGFALPAFSGDTRDQLGYWFWVSLWLGKLRDATVPGGIVGLFTDWRQLPVTAAALQSGGLVWRGIVPWHKPNGRPTQGRWSNTCEYLVWGTNGPRTLDGSPFPGFYQERSPHVVEREHITQKPLSIICDLVKIVPKGGMVVDPFMGSGTTGVACSSMGRKFIGIEIERKYFDIACERIENAQRQARMFA